ncbi:hydrolase [Flavimaricola marinus]|uniref:Uncharacterized protein n=1 Tax=Flavimaricola marinus TaxID=1819565 RepID=A0A238LBX9_9RHOB|nr:hydrolase [Flavimaricola marinus]SMY07082.1 hypothetical protein LOM8899_01214 [Flavimaricola marinus]
METNALPHYDDTVNTTGCCPKFNPKGWDGAELHFADKPFVRAETRSALHVPINMDKVFGRVQRNIEVVAAYDPDDYIVLSRDLTPWKAEHLFAVKAPVPSEEAVTLTGDYVTKVFEGPYRKAKDWFEELQRLAAEAGRETDEVYFFYTTCPKCAKAYGENYVVGVVRVA